MKKLIKMIIASLLFSLGTQAQAADWAKRFFKASLVVLASAYVADGATSWGKYESNPALKQGGQVYGWKHTLIKGGFNGGAIAGELILLRKCRHNPRKEKLALRFGMAINGGMAAISIRQSYLNAGFPSAPVGAR